MKFKLTANTHVGEVRDHNEDNFFVCSDLATDDWSFDKSIEYELGDLGSILIVADGMGGMNAGEVASAIAVESSKSYFTENKESVNIQSEDAINEFLKNAIVHAHQEILQQRVWVPL
jgi:serine/threonine protein phosphatase PrpC